MTAAKTVGGLVYPETMKEIEEELAKVIEDFDRAVNVEALRLVRETGTPWLSQSNDSPFSVASCRATAFAWAVRICQGRL